jgi:hypothetical protein
MARHYPSELGEGTGFSAAVKASRTKTRVHAGQYPRPIANEREVILALYLGWQRMAEILRATDRWGRAIVLKEANWRFHILARRPYFNGYENACIGDTIEKPDQVVYDVDYENRENFYRQSPLPPPYDRVFVKVIVEFTEEDDGGTASGEVVTMYLTDRMKPGERQKWP